MMTSYYMRDEHFYLFLIWCDPSTSQNVNDRDCEKNRLIISSFLFFFPPQFSSSFLSSVHLYEMFHYRFLTHFVGNLRAVTVVLKITNKYMNYFHFAILVVSVVVLRMYNLQKHVFGDQRLLTCLFDWQNNYSFIYW